MTAPTEASIREVAFATGHMDRQAAIQGLRDEIHTWAAPMGSAAFEALDSADPRDAESDSTALWVDLRPSEAVVLKRAVDAACERALARCEAVIIEELTAAGVQFAITYPNAPRAREAVPA